MHSKIAFVINPNSGVKKKIDVDVFIKAHISKDVFFDVLVWSDKNDFSEIQKQITGGNYHTAVACGGDGTVNQVASILLNTSISLGILPLGSGNGLARSLGIPMDLKKALKVIEYNNRSIIDTATINDIPFFCTAGIGFDALIAHQFANSETRGFLTYFKTSLQSFFSYKVNHYSIDVDGLKNNMNAFLITIANAPQWGNDIYIAPEADLRDGFLRMSILKEINLLAIPLLGVKLFTKKIHQSALYKGHKGKKITIEFSGSLPVHYDGEPLLAKEKIIIKVLPQSLHVIC